MQEENKRRIQKENASELMELIDENKENIKTGDYVKMADLVNNIYHNGSDERTIIHVILVILFLVVLLPFVNHMEKERIKYEMPLKMVWRQYNCIPTKIETEISGELILFTIRVNAYGFRAENKDWCKKTDLKCKNKIFENYINMYQTCSFTHIEAEKQQNLYM